MKKLIPLFLIFLIPVACQENLEERVAKECKEYTTKRCPTPIRNNTRMDSMSFDTNTRTIRYYYSIFNEADNPKIIESNKKQLFQTLLKAVRNETDTKAYKEAGFNFRYTYHSGKAPQKTLLDIKLTKNDYRK